MLYASPHPAAEVAAFVDSIGVNTHLGYNAQGGDPSNAYNDFASVQRAMQYLGVHQARDQAGYSYYYPLLRQLHNGLGVQFDLYMSTGVAVDFTQQIALIRANLDMISAVEGVNEPDNWPAIYNGMVGPDAAVAEQQQLYADASSMGVPVYNLSIGNPGDLGQLGNLAASTDYSTAHTYPAGGQQPGNWIGGWLQQSSADAPGKPSVQTEAGYSTTPQQGNQGSVPPNVQTVETLNLLVDSFARGVSHTYIYELVDERPDPAGSDREQHFGLFNNDWSPKPSATAIRNLIAILPPDKPGQVSGGSLDFDVAGIPASCALLLQGSDGFYLVVWAEPNIWDGQNESAAPTLGATVSLGQAAQSVEVFDPMVGTSPIASLGGTSTVQVDVTDHPLILRIAAAPGVPLAATAPILPADPQPVSAAAVPALPSGTASPDPVRHRHRVDWDSLADRVTKYHSSTGQWGILDDWLTRVAPDGGSTDYRR